MDGRLRAGLIVPVASWAAHLLAVLLLRPVMCTPWEPVVHVVTLAALAGPGVSGWLGYSTWYGAGGGYDVRGVDARIGRVRFLSLGAMVLSLIFGFTIVGQWMSALIVSPCR